MLLAPRQERRCRQSEAEPGRVSLPPLLCSTDASITSNSAWQASPHLAFQAAPGLPGYQHRPAVGSGGGPPRHRRPDILPESCQRSAQQQWKEELKLRHSVHPLPDQEGQRVWRERAREDGRTRDKKFGLAFSEQHSGRAWMSARARRFEFWAREASWFMCTECHRLEPRPFHQSSHDKNTQLRARQKKCKHCARGIGYKAPVIGDIPGVLRDLTANALWALRPIEIDVGEYRRGDYGYRIHTDMTRLRWRPQSVQDQVASLRGEDRRLAREAWRFLHSRPLPTPLKTWKEHTQFFLLRPSYSAYLSFVAQHDLFLAQAGPQPDKSARSASWKLWGWSLLCGPTFTQRSPSARLLCGWRMGVGWRANAVT